MYKRGNRVDKLCYCVVSVLFAKDLKRFEAIWFGPSALAGEPVSDFKFEMTTWRRRRGVRIERGVFIRNSEYITIY